MTIALRAYFITAGFASLAGSVALLINFRGLGTLWDELVFAHSKEVIKRTHIPWIANPSAGRIWRPYAAVFGIAISVGLILTGLLAE